MTNIQTLQTDILVLGSGGAGLFAALHAHQANPDLHITIAVKGLLGKCGCTRMVQGGYNVALAEGDSVERHFMDTIEGGKWLSDQELAWTLVTKSVERIRELENELGCFFDRNPDGTIHQKAFDNIKAALACDMVLAYPDFSKEFELYTDASARQLGAVIVQENRPIAFFSHKLSEAQQKYSVTELELLSIVEMLKEFHEMLWGQKIKVFTDHQNLMRDALALTSNHVY